MNVDSKSIFDSYDLKGLSTLREAHDMLTFKKLHPHDFENELHEL
jgi:hypothetical protein